MYGWSGAAGSRHVQTFIAIFIAALMTAAAALLDLLTAQVVSAGFFYVAVILAGFWLPWRKAPFALAIITSAVIIARIILTPDRLSTTGEVWVSRASDIGLVWLTAGFVHHIRNLSERLQTQVEISNTLSREMAHRVGNSLQLVAAFLRLRAARMGNDLARQVLETAGLHVASIGRIHRMLLAGEVTELVDSKSFIEALVKDVSSMLPRAEDVPITVQAESAVLTSTGAITLGALLIELITNAIKHAFRHGEQGMLVVRFSDVPDRGQFVLVVEDDGMGIVEQQGSKGFGIQSVTELVRLMNGSVTCEAARPSETRPGTRWQLVFPRETLASPQP